MISILQTSYFMVEITHKGAYLHIISPANIGVILIPYIIDPVNIGVILIQPLI